MKLVFIILFSFLGTRVSAKSKCQEIVEIQKAFTIQASENLVNSIQKNKFNCFADLFEFFNEKQASSDEEVSYMMAKVYTLEASRVLEWLDGKKDLTNKMAWGLSNLFYKKDIKPSDLPKSFVGRHSEVLKKEYKFNELVKTLEKMALEELNDARQD